MDYVCKGRRARLGGHRTVLQLICKIQDCRETEAVLGISCGKYRKYSRMYFIDVWDYCLRTFRYDIQLYGVVLWFYLWICRKPHRGSHGHADICGYSDYCSNDCGIGYEYPLLCRTGTCVWQGSRICLRTYIPECDFYLYYCLQQKHCLCGRWI